ncbi:MAG: GNAT family N-acetyltransferase [Cyanobacteria bacterium CRU_2_1]|nr:GNAT family N-acetyltransferase [Cyanobacteria bacterium RU_5_0]NJR60743.1 GNAT family N-acetyltransferase [Cyanobacteria bacterium CRU_2_1]
MIPINVNYATNTPYPGCILRPARADDMPTIHHYISIARLDPTQLRWSQFWVIQGEELIAFGQLRNFPGVQELGSLFVAPAWRGRGFGTYLAQHLIRQATQPLYLERRADKSATFYARLGFVPVPWQAVPSPLKWKFGLTHLLAKLRHISLVVMHYRGAFDEKTPK